jgi:hypothetical protein
MEVKNNMLSNKDIIRTFLKWTSKIKSSEEEYILTTYHNE